MWRESLLTHSHAASARGPQSIAHFGLLYTWAQNQYAQLADNEAASVLQVLYFKGLLLGVQFRALPICRMWLALGVCESAVSLTFVRDNHSRASHRELPPLDSCSVGAHLIMTITAAQLQRLQFFHKPNLRHRVAWRGMRVAGVGWCHFAWLIWFNGWASVRNLRFLINLKKKSI